MDRFEQRLRKRLQNEEFASGYREMAAELKRMRALDKSRKHQRMSQEKPTYGEKAKEPQDELHP